MLKKFVIILLLLGLIMAGCSAKTDQNAGKEELNDSVEVINEEEAKAEVAEVEAVEAEVVPEPEVEVNAEEVLQEKLAMDFESDLEYYNTHLNELQETLNPVIISLGGEGQTDLSEDTYTLFLTNLEETIEFIEGMQDYSNIEKYKTTNEHLTEGSAHLIGAYVFFNNFYESNYSNSELFFTGLESYNKAIEEFTNVGSMYAEEYNN